MSKKDVLSDADRELFRKEVQNTKPLHSNIYSKIDHSALKPSTVFISSKQHRKEEVSLLNIPHLSSYIREHVQPETTLSFYRTGMNRKDIQKLKKGEYKIEAVLDLHGQTPDDAQDTLCAFIDKQYQQQHRHVLIIHGKGGRCGEAPVIKNLVYCWLPQLPHVLAFHSASAKHGGTGALYVLLKRVSIHAA